MPDHKQVAEPLKLPVELLDHLARHCAMDRPTATRIVAEVLSYFDESVDDFIRRRHVELQRRGFGNAEIFRQLQQEIRGRLFSAETLSERQIRRIIYG